MRTATEIKKEIYETRKAQQKVAFGTRGQNARKFGEYERELDELYRELDKAQNYPTDTLPAG